LTSNGRAFAVPTSLRGNSHGQLGFRKVNVLLASSSFGLEQVELTPDALRDPLATATPFRRGPKEGSLMSQVESGSSYVLNTIQQDRRIANDSAIRFCTTLTEIPSLRGVAVSQIATGGRATFARVGGRALAWGANEHG
jgi:hypothetical protein